MPSKKKPTKPKKPFKTKKVRPKPARLAAWYAFKFIYGSDYATTPIAAVLRGSYSQSSKRYKTNNVGFQSTANCIVAVTMANIYDMKSWKEELINKILDLGDRLHSISSVRQNKKKRILDAREIVNTFYISDVRISLTVAENDIVGKLRPENDVKYDLKSALELFFENNSYGVCASQSVCVAFWKIDGDFYYFDSHDRDETGKKIKGFDGRACVVKFKTLSTAVDWFLGNLKTDQNSPFVLTAVKLLKMEKMNLRPPESLEQKPPATKPITKALFERPAVPKVEIKPKPPAKVLSSEVVEESSEAAVHGETNEAYVARVAAKEKEEETPTAPKEERVEKQLTDVVRVPSIINVSYYEDAAGDVGIMRASSYTKPELACATTKAAVVMLKFCKSKLWTTGILNDVIKTGKILYKASLLRTVGDRNLVLKDIVDEFVINKVRYTTEVQSITITGKILSRATDIPDFPTALTEFFVDGDCGVVQGPLTVAVWQEDNLYYMFDTNPRNADGLRVKRYERDAGENGAACVTQHKTISTLALTYIKNVEESKKNVPFIVSKIEVKDYRPTANDWNKFKAVAQNKWILRAEFDQGDLQFNKETRNSQCTGIAAIAIAFLSLSPVSKWTSSTLNTILLEGNHYYVLCVENLKKKQKFTHPHLLLAELLPAHVLSQNAGEENRGKRILFHIEDCLVNGLIDNSDYAEALDLTKGMETFFENYKCGVITARNISVAVWRDDGFYYYFDSHSRNAKGLKTPLGTACVIRAERIRDVADAIETNLTAGTENQFNIGLVEVTLQEMNEAGGAKFPVDNEDNRFLEYPNKLVLRATHHEGDAVLYATDVNRQTLPNCLVALGMAFIKSGTSWSVVEMDEILKIGYELYVASVEARINNELYDEYEGIKMNDMLRSFTVGIQKLKATIAEQPISAKRSTLYDHLNEGEDMRSYIIDFGDYAVAVWSEAKTFYFAFDPKERDVYGDNPNRKKWPIEYEDGGEDEGDKNDMLKYKSPVKEDFFKADGDAATDKPSRTSSAKSSEWENAEGEGKEEYNFEVPGKSCLLIFTDVKELSAHLTTNVPPEKRDGSFLLYPTTMEVAFETRAVESEPKIKETETPAAGAEDAAAEETDEPKEEPLDLTKYAGDWFDFKEIRLGFWIVRGTMSEENVYFPETNRGHQDAAIAITAVVFKKLYAMRDWQTTTVDAILKYGDRLHSYTLKCIVRDMKANKALNLETEEIQAIVKGTEFTPKQIYPEFYVGEYKYKVTIEHGLLNGEINARETDEVLTIKKGLQFHFENNKTCIVNVKRRNVAVWRGQKAYYAFDPHSRGPRGRASSVGVACVTRYLDIETLSKLLIANLESDGKNRWTLDGVTVSREESVVPERKALAVPNDLPAPSAFKEIAPGKNIVRANTSQNDEKFGPFKNAQYAANAVVALGMKTVHKTETWSKAILDEILNMASRLFATTIHELGYTFNPWEDKLTLNQIQNRYQIGVQKICCKYLNDANVKGVIDTKTATNLRAGVEKLFGQYPDGVIQSEELTVAVWTESNNYFMFDPSPRSSTGMNATDDGVACLLSFRNPKLLTDHFVANLSACKRQGPFIVTPVEVVYTKGEEKKRDKKEEKKQDKKEEKKVLKRKLDTVEEKKSHDKRCAGHKKQKPDAFVALKPGEEILVGSMSQSCNVFSQRSRGFQATANCVMAIVMRYLVPLDKWASAIIDTVLHSGDQLYKDSFLFYKPDNFDVGLKHVLREFSVAKSHRISIVVYKPCVAGKLIDFELEAALGKFFTYGTDGILQAEGVSVAIFQKNGRYYLFDPHDRNDEGNATYRGKACLMKFNDTRQLVLKFINNVTVLNKSELGSFDISAISVTNIRKCR